MPCSRTAWSLHPPRRSSDNLLCHNLLCRLDFRRGGRYSLPVGITPTHSGLTR
jgi:hypothetical protein